jgi:hypothetical protein
MVILAYRFIGSAPATGYASAAATATVNSDFVSFMVFLHCDVLSLLFGSRGSRRRPASLHGDA